MGFSPLADMSRRIPDGGRSSPRNSRIRGVTLHHQAGVDAHGEATNPRREVSAHYWVTNAGVIIPQIDETRRAWTTGDRAYPAGARSDHRNITMEISNSPAGVRSGTWAISDAAMNAVIRLVADIFRRHNLGPVRRGTESGVGVHRDFVATSCPGPYIMANLSRIIASAESIRSGATTPTKPATPTTSTATSGGLTMSEAAAIKADTEYIRKQLVAIADGTYSRKALDRHNQDVATIVKAAVDAQSRVLIDAFGKLGVSTVDMNALKAEVRKAVADSMDGATLEITARHDGEEG